MTVPAPAGYVCYRESHALGRVPAVYLIEDGPGRPLAMCAPCARADRRDQLARCSKRQLCAMLRRGVVTPAGGRHQWIGGAHAPEAWRKDELTAWVAEAEYPDPEVS